MKKKRPLSLSLAVIAGASLLALLGSCKEQEFNPDQTRTFTIESAINGASYEVTVGLPRDYNLSEKYSSIYVLDGEQDFDFVANQCRAISETRGAQNVVVISIGYGQDRSIDYTPTRVSSITGGGPDFMKFIETQLIPRIEKDFSVDTTSAGRVILGHSYGGLFGACVFGANNDLFGNYIMLSPSIWFDNEVCLQLEVQTRALNQSKNTLVFMGIGEAENSGRMQAPFEAFYQALRDNYPNIKLSRNREEDLDHMGSKNPNIKKGLTYYFESR